MTNTSRPGGTCRATGCSQPATHYREQNGTAVPYCEICYLERTAVDVRRVQRTLRADAYTANMFGED